MSGHPPFHCIVGTLRSGTSLLGHLLAEVARVQYAGESHVVPDGPEAIGRAWEILRDHLPPGSDASLPFCDKVLVPGDYRDEGRPLRENAGMIYLSLRHPLAVLASLKRLGWKWGNCDYLRDQLKVMLHLLKTFPPEQVQVIAYYDLTQRERRAVVLGQEVESYQILPKTGESGWGIRRS